MSLIPPPEVADPALWLEGYTLRQIHRPTSGAEAVCPACEQPWPCPDYLLGLDALNRATWSAQARWVTGDDDYRVAAVARAVDRAPADRLVYRLSAYRPVQSRA